MTEAQIQASIVRWFNNTYCLKNQPSRAMIFAVPNGGSRNPLEAVNLKATGVLPGVSDLIVIYNDLVLFVEVKNEKGVLSDRQFDFKQRIDILSSFMKINYYLVRSLEEFQNLIVSL